MSDTFTVNGQARAWQDMSVADLLAADGVALNKGGVAVALNAGVVPRGAWAETRIRPSDRIEIVHIVRGG